MENNDPQRKNPEQVTPKKYELVNEPNDEYKENAGTSRTEYSTSLPKDNTFLDRNLTPTPRRQHHSDSLEYGSLPAISEDTGIQHHHPHLAIDFIRERSYSIDSSKINDEFYKEYLELDAAKPQESYGFVQLDVLSVGAERSAREWCEVSRWIKYQEDLEERAGRWGHPHIASLTYNSISTLKNLLETNGIFLADVHEDTFRGIISRVVDELVVKEVITRKETQGLITTLLAKRKHVEEKATGWLILKRVVKAMGASSLQNIFDEKQSFKSLPPLTHVMCNEEQPSFSGDRQGYRTNGPQSMDALPLFPKSLDTADPGLCQEQTIPQKNTSLRNLLPQSAEATVVMVADIEVIKKSTVLVIRLSKSVVLGDVTEVEIPLRFVIIILVPTESDIDLLEVGRSFGTLMSNTNFFGKTLIARGLENLSTAINQFLDESITISPGNWDNYDLLSRHKLQDKNHALRFRRKRSQAPLVAAESLLDVNKSNLQPTPAKAATRRPAPPVLESPFTRTGRPFGGLINDLKRRYPKYKSDILDGLNFQCLATVIFMYFASLAQIIPFAVLMGEKTKNMIGISETLLPTAGAGIFFALTAGQPLLLLGTTGPLLVFDEILFKVCERIDIEFLPTRVWVSIWLIVITLIAEFFDASVMIKWCTRFTQDIFTVLTSFLLIYECFDSVIKIYSIHPLKPCTELLVISGSNFSRNNTFLDISSINSGAEGRSQDMVFQPNTALICTCLTIGTFSIAFGLREFKKSIYLSEKIRKNLGHFAVPIAIGLMLTISLAADGAYIPKMRVPKGFEPTCPKERGWLIPPTGIRRTFSPWIALACILPALLIFVLMFLTTDICELLIDTKEKRLSKGNGFHLDILLVAIINFGCGLFGAPWICAPPMRTIAHTDALTVYSKINPPGEKPSFIGVKEQRLTSLVISILIGCSILMSSLLQEIPLAVLFGVFLYMGVSALHTTQLFLRINLLFIPTIHHPNVSFVKKVRTKKMHLYTGVQICCLVVMWGLMAAKELALFFPFILMLLVPIRLQLTRFFTQEELEVLDGEIPMKI